MWFFFTLQGVACAVVLFVCSFLWLASYIITRPSHVMERPEAVDEAAKCILNGIQFSEVTFPAIDNQTLSGWWIPAPLDRHQGILLSCLTTK